MIYVLMVVHVVLAVGLIVFVLLHSGKGTGLSSMLGAFASAPSGTTLISQTTPRIQLILPPAVATTSPPPLLCPLPPPSRHPFLLPPRPPSHSYPRHFPLP